MKHKNTLSYSTRLKILIFILGLTAPLFPQTINAPEEDWLNLFNAVDLSGWEFKIRYREIGDDPYNTFRVSDSILHVDYSNYPNFEGEPFGHIWYTEREFSYYIIRVLYNFKGEQVIGGPDWAYQNNGIMFHSQSIESMDRNRDFPVSVELQLLGTDNNLNSTGTTANLCSPQGTAINGGADNSGCWTADHVSQEGLEWVKVEAMVLGDSLVKHIVEGDTVLEYGDLVYDDGRPLSKGYIALQAESSPYQFKAVQLLNLEGCMDEQAGNYRDYYLKSDPASCIDPIGIQTLNGRNSPFYLDGYTLHIFEKGHHTAEVFNIQGQKLALLEGDDAASYNLKPFSAKGLHILKYKQIKPDGASNLIWVKFFIY